MPLLFAAHPCLVVLYFNDNATTTRSYVTTVSAPFTDVSINGAASNYSTTYSRANSSCILLQLLLASR